MLTELQIQQPKRRRALPSLRQQYQSYILQRIEEYKNSLTRPQLLELGNEAVAEMETAGEEQLFLTEVVVADWVDRLIQRRLNLQPFNRWVQSFRRLRAAQKVPTRWGLDPRCPVARILPRLEPGDTALVIGREVEPVVYLLAAHEVRTTYTGDDLTFADQVEARAAQEVLGHCVTTLVAPIGHLIDGIPAEAHVVAVDTGSLERLSARERQGLVRALMDRTAAGGVHLILPSGGRTRPEAFASYYVEWTVDAPRTDRRQAARPIGLVFCKPPEVAETATRPRRSGGATA